MIDFVADDGQVLDLHNGGQVVGIAIEMPADLFVRLTYSEPARWAEGARPGTSVITLYITPGFSIRSSSGTVTSRGERDAAVRRQAVRAPDHRA